MKKFFILFLCVCLTFSFFGCSLFNKASNSSGGVSSSGGESVTGDTPAEKAEAAAEKLDLIFFQEPDVATYSSKVLDDGDEPLVVVNVDYKDSDVKDIVLVRISGEDCITYNLSNNYDVFFDGISKEDALNFIEYADALKQPSELISNLYEQVIGDDDMARYLASTGASTGTQVAKKPVVAEGDSLDGLIVEDTPYTHSTSKNSGTDADSELAATVAERGQNLDTPVSLGPITIYGNTDWWFEEVTADSENGTTEYAIIPYDELFENTETDQDYGYIDISVTYNPSLVAIDSSEYQDAVQKCIDTLAEMSEVGDIAADWDYSVFEDYPVAVADYIMDDNILARTYVFIIDGYVFVISGGLVEDAPTYDYFSELYDTFIHSIKIN